MLIFEFGSIKQKGDSVSSKKKSHRNMHTANGKSACRMQILMMEKARIQSFQFVKKGNTTFVKFHVINVISFYYEIMYRNCIPL